MVESVRYMTPWGEQRFAEYQRKEQWLPVFQTDGKTRMVRWGSEISGRALPSDKVIYLNYLKNNQFSAFRPKPVKLDILEYTAAGRDRDLHLIKISPGDFIQGAYLSVKRDSFLEEAVYIVMEDTPHGDKRFKYVPRILRGVR